MLTSHTKPLIMGILNVTPDSFSDGGRFNTLTAALKHTEQMLADGADIIDIGGESTRPYSLSVSSGEQIHRVIPVIKAIRAQISDRIPISIDTRLSAVARLALAEGANIINDVSAGQDDPELLALAAQTRCPMVLMHRQGNALTMQQQPFYSDVVGEVLDSLQASVARAVAAGIDRQQLIIDPGIGFGKRLADDLGLLQHLPRFVATGIPVLLGTSRKQCLRSVTGSEQEADLAVSTAATTALAVMAGVSIVRVHDVKANRQALEIAWAIRQHSSNA